MALSFHSNYEQCLPELDQTLQYNTTNDYNNLIYCQDQDKTTSNFDNDTSTNLFMIDNPQFDLEPKLEPASFPNDYCCSDSTYSDLLNYATISLSPGIFPLEQDQLEPYPKRQKSNENPSCLTTNASLDTYDIFLDEYMVNPFLKVENPGSSGPEIEAAVGGPGVVKKPALGSETSLSAQSVAARERRRKISEKTQEVGKLIPGGSKMNTAEMFQAAAKYVKFLQAQVGILQFIDSLNQEKMEPNMEAEKRLQFLLASSTIQKKLYSEEMCLVPTDLVKTIANDHEILSSNADLNQLRLLELD